MMLLLDLNVKCPNFLTISADKGTYISKMPQRMTLWPNIVPAMLGNHLTIHTTLI